MTNFLFERIDTMLWEINDYIVKKSIKLDGFYFKQCGYKSDNILPPIDDTFTEFWSKDTWGDEKDFHAWFYKKVEIPAEWVNKPIELKINIEPKHHRNFVPQFIVYIDGELRRGLDGNHQDIILCGKESYEIYVYAYIGRFHGFTTFNMSLNEINDDVRALYYNLKVPHEIMEYLDEDEKTYLDIRTHLNNALNYLNWCNPGSDEFIESVKNANSYLESEFYQRYCEGEREATVVCIGHTHIDVAWLWTLAQTREKAVTSFSSVVDMMKKYPEYKFMSSQPQLYKYVKQDAPSVYEDIKRLVKEGRWEAEGSMWVEADTNLASGESLIRQILFGKRFFKNEFGVDNKVLWLPDVFGYSAALPQILKKSGIDKFVTSKIGWNETNRVPYDTFDWYGIDGTKMFTYFLTAQDKERGVKPETKTTYNASFEPNQVQGTWDRYQQKDIYNEVLYTFGWGDGGGGPTDLMLENYERLKRGIKGGLNVKMEFAGSYLERMKKTLEDNKYLPKWYGELYLEFHRGTYTSMAHNKRSNRKSEQLYQSAEMFSYMNKLLLGGEYKGQLLDDGWETILLNQFHDIIPGSSIKEVYDDSRRDYERVISNGNAVLNEATDSIANNINTNGGLLVFNPHSFVHSGIVDVDGEKVYAENIPAKGYKVVSAKAKTNSVKISDKKMENNRYIIEFDNDYFMSRIYDKANNREVLRSGGRGNILQAYEDYPREYDAWEITNYYTEKMYEVNDVSKVKVITCGEAAGFEIERKFHTSTITQKIYLYENSDRIDFDTTADWHTEHVLLKSAFELDINATTATYDIQFGAVERPTHSNTSWESAKFEVCAHKFADLSEYGYGVSILNDCKYGHDIHNGNMKLTLLRCATNPNPQADKGHHEFIYSLLPHAGDYREASVVQQAYDLNIPMIARKISKQTGVLPEEYSLFSIDCENVIIETAKKAQDSESLIVRMYEAYNKKTTSTLSFAADVKAVYLCSTLEEHEQELAVNENSVTFEIKPFEIITLSVEF